MTETRSVPGFVFRDHRFNVPLDHSRPRGEKISIFAREVAKSGTDHNRALPWLVFLQGGPGFPSPRPGNAAHGVLSRALRDYRVLLLDQRGTGLSTPVTCRGLVSLGNADAIARYLRNFRADSIVKDCELIRRQLLGDRGAWSLLGQSFGGFIAATYLSFAPERLSNVFITGGIPPVGARAEQVYRATYPRIAAKNRAMYQAFPDDAAKVSEIVAALEDRKTRLPTGDVLSPERFLQLGISFGMSGGFSAMHYLVEGAFEKIGRHRSLSYSFLRQVENNLNFDTNPIYAILHEAIYCEGTASNWAADRVRAEFPEFSLDRNPPMFSGETVHRWMFSQYGSLAPLARAADLLAAYDGWQPLYDTKQLGKNEVPVTAAVYYDDMYVDRELSESAAQKVRGIKLWVTNEFEHDGVRSAGDVVLDKLFALAKGDTVCHATLLSKQPQQSSPKRSAGGSATSKRQPRKSARP